MDAVCKEPCKTQLAHVLFEDSSISHAWYGCCSQSLQMGSIWTFRDPESNTLREATAQKGLEGAVSNRPTSQTPRLKPVSLDSFGKQKDWEALLQVL